MRLEKVTLENIIIFIKVVSKNVYNFFISDYGFMNGEKLMNVAILNDILYRK